MKALAFVLEIDVIHGVKRIEAKEFVEEKELAEIMGWQSIGNSFSISLMYTCNMD